MCSLARSAAGLTSTLTLIALAVCAALTVEYAHVTERMLLLHGMYVADELAFALKLAAFAVVAVALLYSRSFSSIAIFCAGNTTSWHSRRSSASSC